MKLMNLSAGMPVTVGPWSGMIYGGPYRKYIPGQRRLIGIKMAAELDCPCDINIPTEDFSVPDVQDMGRGLIGAVQALSSGKDVYVGCMGGVGRTGLFMGCMAKLMLDEGFLPPGTNVIQYVREAYMPYAIETKEQQAYVTGFDTSFARAMLQNLLAPHKVEPPTCMARIKQWWSSLLTNF